MRRRAKLEGKVPKARRSRPQGPAREERRAARPGDLRVAHAEHVAERVLVLVRAGQRNGENEDPRYLYKKAKTKGLIHNMIRAG